MPHLRKAYPMNQRTDAPSKPEVSELWDALNRRDESLVTRILNLRAANDRLTAENTALRSERGASADEARNGALEEAARVCESLFASHYDHSQRKVGGIECAKAIRNLKDAAMKASK